MNAHYAMIGMAFVNQNTPLYYDATNEKGLSMAGLHFPGNAVYRPAQGERYAASYELIPWLLCRYETVEQVKDEMKHLTISDLSFSDDLPATPLHWLVADRKDAITIEAVAEGKVNLKGIVTDIFDLDDCQNAMDSSRDRKADIVKAVIKIHD